MGIKKMNLITVIGSAENYDSIIRKYICGKDIHLENAMSVLDNAKDLKPFDSANPYSEKYKQLTALLDGTNIFNKKINLENHRANYEKWISDLSERHSNMSQKLEEIDRSILSSNEMIKQLEPISSLNIDLETLSSFEFIKIRFGKMPKDSYKKMNYYLDELEAIFLYGQENRDYVWGTYFTLEPYLEKVERVFSSLYFEPMEFEEKLSGTAHDIIKQLEDKIKECEKERSDTQNEYFDYIKQNDYEIAVSYNLLKSHYDANEFCHYCASDGDSFYFTGWVGNKTLKKLEHELKGVNGVMIMSEKAEKAPKHISPPTLLRNNPIFRPFEFFIKMYGLPSYNEIDPTPIVALTYILMFGIMFGDVGQGLVMAIGGFIIYKLKKNDLAAIIGMVGASSTIFGLLYGSVFGFEEILHKTVIIRPMENIMTMLIGSVGFGVLIIVMAMALNLVNAVRQKSVAKFLFSQNGIAGLVFYLAVIFGVIMIFMKRNVFTIVYNIVFIVLPLILIMFQSPLSRLLEKKKKLIDGSKGEFILENIFELFDIVLSFVTNTISFVRVGAFALNHVGMMSVVFIFSKMASGTASTLVIVLGNILVMGLEGLIVGIQVLRLEFYEIFSRFYDGSGKEFKSAANINK